MTPNQVRKLQLFYLTTTT